MKLFTLTKETDKMTYKRLLLWFKSLFDCKQRCAICNNPMVQNKNKTKKYCSKECVATGHSLRRKWRISKHKQQSLFLSQNKDTNSLDKNQF